MIVPIQLHHHIQTNASRAHTDAYSEAKETT